MKYIYLLFSLFVFSACSKEEGYGSFNLKDGQEVELLISHRYGAVGDIPLLLPKNESPQLPISGFDEREPGYTYRVKAKMVAYKGHQMMDGGPMSLLNYPLSDRSYLDRTLYAFSKMTSITNICLTLDLG